MIAGEAKLHRLVDLQRPDWIAEEGRETLKGLITRQAQLLQGKPMLRANEGK
jgi:hypothetical protein